MISREETKSIEVREEESDKRLEEIKENMASVQSGEFQIYRPVKPTGKSFSKVLYGYLIRNVKEFEKYKREWNKKIMKLAFAIEDKVGDHWILCKIKFEAIDGRPSRLSAYDIVVLKEESMMVR